MNKYNNTSPLPFKVINIILIANILYYYIRKTYTAVLSDTWHRASTAVLGDSVMT